MAVWGLLDFLMLAAGGGLIALSILLKAPDALRGFILTDFDLNFGLVVGILYVTTFAISIGAIIQRNHVTIGLAILNWVLMFNTVVTVVFGSNLWFMTLQEEKNFGNLWTATTSERRIGIQDQLQCCGFANSTAVEAGGFCADAANTLNNGCDVKIISIADTMLMDAFTTVYSFTAILTMFFLATMCVIKKRQEQERFRRIDSKRGGRGFV